MRYVPSLQLTVLFCQQHIFGESCYPVSHAKWPLSSSGTPSLPQTFVKSQHKFGVLSVKQGQRTEEEIFSNSHEPGPFDEFLKVLGRYPSNYLIGGLAVHVSHLSSLPLQESVCSCVGLRGFWEVWTMTGILQGGTASLLNSVVWM